MWPEERLTIPTPAFFFFLGGGHWPKTEVFNVESRGYSKGAPPKKKWVFGVGGKLLLRSIWLLRDLNLSL